MNKTTRYPYKVWLDGRPHALAPGKDFEEGKHRSVYVAVTNYCRRLGIPVRIQMSGSQIYIEALVHKNVKSINHQYRKDSRSIRTRAFHFLAAYYPKDAQRRAIVEALFPFAEPRPYVHPNTRPAKPKP